VNAVTPLHLAARALQAARLESITPEERETLLQIAAEAIENARR